MPKYVAFLRAINVGGHVVKMDHLRLMFEELNFKNVETFIASGNVIFDTTAKNTRSLEKKIEDNLKARLGYEVATFIRSMAEIASIARLKPFGDAGLNEEGQVLYIGFMADKPADASCRKLQLFSTEVEEFCVVEREVYWLHRRRLGDSALTGAILEKTLGMKATLRNSNTIKRIAAKYA